LGVFSMKCPRCSLFDIPDGAPACAVCGYQLPVPTVETAVASSAAAAAAAAAPALTELDARRELAREFRIEALLPTGDETATAVYLAYDPRQDRQVEVKVAPRQPLRDAGAEDRFRRAAEAAAALDHPHIIPIYRCGTTASFVWFSTKYVEGRSVAEVVRTNGPMDLAHCQRILEQVASALDYAHRRGVFHGALSSGNIVLDANEWALVGDFAVAEVVASAREAAAVFNARGPTPGADQYALAALAYECLSGTKPAGEASPNLSELRTDVPPHVSEALRQAMSKRPVERFPSVLDLVAAVGGTSPGAGAGARAALFSLNPRRGPGSPVVIMDDEPEPRRVGRRVAAAAGLVIALGAGGVWLTLSSLPAAPPLDRRMGRPPANATLPAPPPPPAPQAAPPVPRDTLPTAVMPRPQTDAPRATARPLAPAWRPAAPRVTHTTPPRTVAKPPPPPASAGGRMELGRLFVNSVPWGNAYLDGQLLGTVPLKDLPVWPGTHSLRIEREGFQPYERTFEIGSGQQLKITDIVLRELAP
jgi:hypothetical protein